MREILTEARTLLKAGWVQEEYVTTQYGKDDQPIRCYCAVGAIKKSLNKANVDDFDGDVQAAAQAVITANKIRGGRDDDAASRLITWNDRKVRTKKQVVDAFTNAIKACPRKKAASVK